MFSWSHGILSPCVTYFITEHSFLIRLIANSLTSNSARLGNIRNKCCKPHPSSRDVFSPESSVNSVVQTAAVAGHWRGSGTNELSFPLVGAYSSGICTGRHASHPLYSHTCNSRFESRIWHPQTCVQGPRLHVRLEAFSYALLPHSSMLRVYTLEQCLTPFWWNPMVAPCVHACFFVPRMETHI